MAKLPVLDKAQKSQDKILTGAIPAKMKYPVLQGKDFSVKFTFSFQYFRQIRYFEIGGVDNSWYISLISRLQELSKKDFHAFERDFREKKNYRYHEINWNGENVPINRSDLNWIDDYYLGNDEDFPIFQFQISKALGRVVGFWDAYHVFQIVLLDPKHNIQPSKYNDYKVDDTYFMSCQYSSLIVDINNLKKKIAKDCKCITCSQLKNIPSKLNQTNIIIAHIDDSFKEKVDELNLNIQDVLEMGILGLSQ